MRVRSPRDAISAGFALVPEDRKRSGLVANRSVRENVAMVENAPIFPRFFVASHRDRALAQRYVTELQIRTPDIETPVRVLSGGNQQKVVIGKWLAARPKIWLLDEPTRGIDVGAKSEIFRLMGELAAAGTAILMSSSELIDLLGVCDRVLVMFRGRIVGEMSRAEATEERVVYYATGQSWREMSSTHEVSITVDGVERSQMPPPAAPTDLRARARALLALLYRGCRRFLGVSIALVLMMIYLTITQDSFLTSTNLTNILRSMTVLFMVSIGNTFVLLTARVRPVGGVDALARWCCAGGLLGAGVNPWLAVLLTLMLCTALGGGL